MKIVKVESMTGMGMRPFIRVIPESIEDGVSLGHDFLESDKVGSAIYPTDNDELAGSIDPERLVEYLNEYLFMDELSDEQVNSLKEVILDCFPSEK